MKIYWRMTKATYSKYLEYSDGMVQAAMDGNTYLQKEFEDKFRSLPGLPRGINLDLDLVVPVITDESATVIAY